MEDVTAFPTPTFDDIVTATSTLLDVVATSLTTSIPWNDGGSGGGFGDDMGIPTNGSNPFDVFDNSTMSTPESEIIGDSEGNYILNTFIGLLIVLLASVLNALGLNLTKLDHVRQQGIPKRQRKKEWMRVLWLSGMGMYIASQVFGSPLALRYLRPDWVAPLGSSSLVLNFLFAHWLVGTPVTPTDIQGTIIIIFGVILIIVFSSINHGLKQSLDIERLNSLWTRGPWLVYFVLIVAFITSTYLVSSLFASLLASRASFSPLPSPTLELPTSRPAKPNAFKAFFLRIGGGWKRLEGIALKRMERFFARTDDARLIWLQGMGWAVCGGSLAGLCLVFTKAAVKLFGLPGHPLVHPSAIISLLLVIITAVLQIVCLDRALKCADTVVVVPLFFAVYTVFGFINSLIFYNEAGQYARWVLIAVFVSIAVLVSGVVLLSLKSSAKIAPDPYTVSAQPGNSMRLNPRSHARRASAPGGADDDIESTPTKSKKYDQDDIDELDYASPGPGGRREDVLWEVGSVSDASDDEGGEGRSQGKGKGKGVGGIQGGSGERRGLLGEEEEDLHENEEGGSSPVREKKKDPFRDGDDDGFGEYEGVTHEDADVEDGDASRKGKGR
ncbi:hypothetical protein I316_01909 [Kwoniella heveanensis BCC8398]|uniref:Magnesium transporter NIPA-domain-containing protein n=1 Tax=Kwoniella heveanensis BCC8398 TaxID=1296120 RepID=A0A1B9H050_9TREE|nr:hypothetical protein I316_01909 [Kwoniella heveanensis BCC8398]